VIDAMSSLSMLHADGQADRKCEAHESAPADALRHRLRGPTRIVAVRGAREQDEPRVNHFGIFAVFRKGSRRGRDSKKPFFGPSPAIRFAERAEGVKGPKR
jgi:hypothetical protein